MEARIEQVSSPGRDGAPDGNTWIVGDDEDGGAGGVAVKVAALPSPRSAR